MSSLGTLFYFFICLTFITTLVECSNPNGGNDAAGNDGAKDGGSAAKRLSSALPDRYLSGLKDAMASASESIGLSSMSMVNDAPSSSTEHDDGVSVSHLDHRHHHHHHHHFPSHGLFGGAQDFVEKFIEAFNRSAELLASRLRNIEEKLSIVIECALNETSTVSN